MVWDAHKQISHYLLISPKLYPPTILPPSQWFFCGLPLLQKNLGFLDFYLDIK